MSKKDNELRGGLNALFGNRSEVSPETIGAEPEEAQAAATAPDPDSDTSAKTRQQEIIDSVDDEELKEALHRRQIKGRGRPRKGCSSPEQTKLYTRISTIAHKDKYAKIMEIAFRESLQIKEVIEAAMDLAIEAYESKHGEIKLSQKKKGNPKNPFK